MSLPELPDEAYKPIIKFLDKLVHPSIKELGGILSDTTRYWRFNRAITIIDKAKKRYEKLGLDPDTIPVKFLAPFLENCSLEEEESMQEKWANLLVSASSPERNKEINHVVFIRILNDISPGEAKFLESLVSKSLQKQKEGLPFPKLFNLDSSINRIYTDNLVRLNLVEYVLHSTSQGQPLGNTVFRSDRIRVTDLGLEFVKAVSE